MRKLVVALAIAAVAAVGIVSTAGASSGPKGFTIAVYGDSPYGNSQKSPPDTAQYQNSPGFIATMNNDPDVSLVAHVGDIHSGKEFCTSDYDTKIQTLWTSFTKPLVYTPGDNEWSDCHKPGEGGGLWTTAADGTKFIDYNCASCFGNVDYAGGNPLDNLALVRSLFFANPGTSLGAPMKVTSQANAYDHKFPTDRNYVENVRWENKNILFVNVNIPGGSNDDADPWFGAGAPATSPLPQQQADERAQRQGADLRWLDAAFVRAKENGDKAVVVLEQADMWDLDGKAVTHVANYEPYIKSIADHTSAFGKPVLLFNGDSHIYRSDNPLQTGASCTMENQAQAKETSCAQAATDNPSLNITADASQNHPGYDVANFHRVTVHGSTSLEWLKLAIEPGVSNTPSANSFGPFSWERKPYTP